MHSGEQKLCVRLRDETTRASLEETKAPQDAHLTISAPAVAGRPLNCSRSFLTSLIVPLKLNLIRAIALKI